MIIFSYVHAKVRKLKMQKKMSKRKYDFFFSWENVGMNKNPFLEISFKDNNNPENGKNR